MQKFTYNSKFEGNILVEGKTDSGKTTFIQNLDRLIVMEFAMDLLLINLMLSLVC